VQRGVATAYEGQGDMDLIEVLNRCGRVPVSGHRALLQRLRNRSYKKKVFFRADELNDASLRPLVTGRIGIRFPLHSEKKLVPVLGCYEVTLIEARRRDWEVMVACAEKDGFGSVIRLDIEKCVEFKSQEVAVLFPNLEVIVIDDCHSLEMMNIECFRKLHTLEFRSIIGTIELPKAGCLGRVREIVLRDCGNQPHVAALKDGGIHVSVEVS
jgi:hypothetical protein